AWTPARTSGTVLGHERRGPGPRAGRAGRRDRARRRGPPAHRRGGDAHRAPGRGVGPAGAPPRLPRRCGVGPRLPAADPRV
ncbi:MAG: hypothetical protein AVDCRST_MAG54-3088, partial [uncultured Actinomycetospora sp.]